MSTQPDSPLVGRPYCPRCEPEADPTAEILDVRWCDAHRPAPEGTDDTRATARSYLSGSTEAGGEANRRWCDFLHRGILTSEP